VNFSKLTKESLLKRLGKLEASANKHMYKGVNWEITRCSNRMYDLEARWHSITEVLSAKFNHDLSYDFGDVLA